MANISEAKDVVIALAAFTGMGLGLYNFLRERKKEKVNLKVVPKTVVQRSSGVEGGFSLSSTNEFDPNRNAGLFGIEVINLSTFPVVISEVGFIKHGKNGRMSIVKPILDDSGKWPRKLEPRESVSAYGLIDEMVGTGSLHLVTEAYADTSCGNICTGSSQALNELVNWGKFLHKGS